MQVVQRFCISKSLPIVLSLDPLFENLSTGPIRYKDMTFGQLMDERESLKEKEAQADGRMSEERKHLQLYIHENLSQAYSVFALSLVAIPLAIRVGRKESLINVLIALLIALLYHLLTVSMSWFDGVEEHTLGFTYLDSKYSFSIFGHLALF